MPYHITITIGEPPKPALAIGYLDKDEAWIDQHIAGPRRLETGTTLNGRYYTWDQIHSIRIIQTDRTSEQLRATRHSRSLIGKIGSTLAAQTFAKAAHHGTPDPDELDIIATEGTDATSRFITGAPHMPQAKTSTGHPSRTADRKAVMVIYGHDREANTALFSWLRAIGLQPQEWAHLIQLSGSASPYIGDVLQQAFQHAQAVIAFFTPDERVRGRGSLPGASHTWRLQARPNVLIEAGMALVTHPDRTVLITLGTQELPSDLAGRHYIRLNGTPGPLNDIANRLRAAGCDTNLTGTDWLDANRFPHRDHIPLPPPDSANRDKNDQPEPGPYDAADDDDEMPEDPPPRQPGPVFTDRWRNLPNGNGFPALMETGRHTITHPGYRDDNKPPSIQTAALVACSPLGSAPGTSQIRASVLAFLNAPAISTLLAGATSVPEDTAWTVWDDRPRRNFSAVLTGSDQQAAPVAWARLILPQAEPSFYDQAPRSAQLVLHVYPRTPEGHPGPPADLPTWHCRIARVLALPGALAEFLARDLHLTTTDDPPAQAGICLDTPRTITELVDPQDLLAVPGSSVVPWFRGWAVAEPDGQLPTGLVHDWLTDMCDNTLHVSDYEHILETLRAPEPPPLT